MDSQFTTFKFFTSPEKEEAWLDQMALRGWFLVKMTSFCTYTFKPGEPEKGAYKIDYHSFSRSRDREDYLALFMDSGWQPVMRREVNAAFYFYSSRADLRRDIFSDEVSRAQCNLRYASLSACSLIPAFLPLFVVYLTGNYHLGPAAYLTPGLWEMTGREFVFHFLFETPFVLLRGGAFFLPLVPVSLALIFLLRYYLTYRKAVRQQAP
jgi:hypothetical protein